MSHARQMFEALVGRRTGIVREVICVPPGDGDANLYYAAATIANAHPETAAGVALTVGGAGTSRDAALMSALGEGLERYAASAHCRGRARLQAAAELSGPHLSPASLAQFSSEQRTAEGFPFMRADERTPMRWLAGRNAADGSHCWAPAFAVHVPYWPEAGEPLVAPAISTGLCCAASREAAILGGACEVIERDALALTWLQGRSSPRIDEAWFREVAGDMLPPDDEVAAFDLTSDVGVPVVLAVCRGAGPRGRLLSVGSACHPDPLRAMRKAAMEAAQDRVYVRQLLDMDPDWRPLADFSNVTDFSYHARLYSACPEMAGPALEFLELSSARRMDLQARPVEARADLEVHPAEVIACLRAAGHEAVYVDLTPEWSAAMNLHVVKVVIPSLLPLHGAHRLAYVGHERLRNGAAAMPRSTVQHSHAIWPFPHPLP